MQGGGRGGRAQAAHDDDGVEAEHACWRAELAQALATLAVLPAHAAAGRLAGPALHTATNLSFVLCPSCPLSLSPKVNSVPSSVVSRRCGDRDGDGGAGKGEGGGREGGGLGRSPL